MQLDLIIKPDDDDDSSRSQKMHRWHPKGVDGHIIVRDPWERYERMYHAPTKYELGIIAPFVLKFEFEDDEFNEDEDEEWVYTKKSRNIPDLRRMLTEFVEQVRATKGYEVDIPCGFFGSPFRPLKLDVKKDYDEAISGANTAIEEINRRTLKRDIKYRLVTLDKCVKTNSRHLLLTISALETDLDAMDIDGGNGDADGLLKTIQALLATVQINPTKTEFKLLEWKFKPESYFKLVL